MDDLSTDDPLAVATVQAIHSGDVDALRQLLAKYSELASVRLGGNTPGNFCAMSRTLLHVATDWPGHYPNGSAIVALLIEAGAEVNARFAGPHTETPLHWAASSDDVAVLDVLLDHGADIEADGGVIGNGTPIADAAAFGQWKAARRLIERGATTMLWQAASLGLMDRVKRFFAESPAPTAEDVTSAFWCACHGGQREAAEYLLAKGADINWVGYDNLTSRDAAVRSGANELVAWLFHRGAKSAQELC
jgi:ankyrin repeat protein